MLIEPLSIIGVRFLDEIVSSNNCSQDFSSTAERTLCMLFTYNRYHVKARYRIPFLYIFMGYESYLLGIQKLSIAFRAGTKLSSAHQMILNTYLLLREQ